MCFSDPEPKAKQPRSRDQQPAPRQMANPQYSAARAAGPTPMAYPARPAASAPPGLEAAYHSAHPKRAPSRPDQQQAAANPHDFDPRAFAAANNFLGGEPSFQCGPQPVSTARKPVAKASLPPGVTTDRTRALGVSRQDASGFANGNDHQFKKGQTSGRSAALYPGGPR